MDLSVIIVNYNAAPFLERCLASLDLFLAGMKHEVCVVDNASTDGSVELIRKRFPQVQLIANRSNLGFAAAVNQGLRKACGRAVLWLNPDAELLADGIVNLLDYLDKHTEVGVIGPQLVNPDGSVQLSCRSFPSYRTALFHRYSLFTRWFPSNPFSREYLLTGWDHTSVQEVDWVSGACLLHRREIVDRIGVLDEKFFMYCEDVDFCLRVRETGWRIHYHPGMQVLHHIGGSSRAIPRRMIMERHRSMWRYYTKHFRRNPLKDAAVILGIAARCAFQIARSNLMAALP